MQATVCASQRAAGPAATASSSSSGAAARRSVPPPRQARRLRLSLAASAAKEILERAADRSEGSGAAKFDARAFRRSLNTTGRYTRKPSNDPESLQLMEEHGVGYSTTGLVAQVGSGRPKGAHGRSAGREQSRCRFPLSQAPGWAGTTVLPAAMHCLVAAYAVTLMLACSQCYASPCLLPPRFCGAAQTAEPWFGIPASVACSLQSPSATPPTHADAGDGLRLAAGRRHREAGRGVRLLLGGGARCADGVRGAPRLPGPAAAHHKRDHPQPRWVGWWVAGVPGWPVRDPWPTASLPRAPARPLSP